MKKKKNLWLPSFIWACFIFLLSSIPFSINLQSGFSFIDKIAHFFIYIPLGFMVAQALYLGENKFLKKNFIILALVICALYGILDEFHQSFVQTRESSALDAFFDFLGSGFGLIFFNLFRRE